MIPASLHVPHIYGMFHMEDVVIRYFMWQGRYWYHIRYDHRHREMGSEPSNLEALSTSQAKVDDYLERRKRWHGDESA